MQHKDLKLEKWHKLSFAEQMANIGSEVGRAIKWQQKNKVKYSQKAFHRALELSSLTKSSLCMNQEFAKLKEICRMYELLVDFFAGDNIYQSSAESWNKYFHAFNYVARK